ncbi:MAG TPA: hypothetical protein EYQ06_09875 [Flavobacteriales bacterium]|nr:hypothetical protein [Flavobacteriales bacterium]HIK62881.1 hypothetical protein [Flavobacteriales bacterium]
MDKDKLIKGLIWLSATSLTILVDANLLYIGFNNVQHGSYTIIVIALLIFPVVFFCAYKGIKSVLDAIFY